MERELCQSNFIDPLNVSAFQAQVNLEAMYTTTHHNIICDFQSETNGLNNVYAELV